MDLVWLLFSANGRVGPMHFWTGAFILFAFGFLSLLIPVAGPLIWWLSSYCWFCLYAKRLHDFGKSVWFEVIVFTFGNLCLGLGVIIGGIGALDAVIANRFNWEMFVGAAGAVIGLLAASGAAHLTFLLYVGFRPTERRANRYGPPSDPRFVAAPSKG